MKDNIKKAFSEIHADSKLKQNTLAKILDKKKKAPLTIFAKIIPIATTMFFALFAVVYFLPYSYISIDINPSIQLDLNRFERVIKAEANNEDAQLLVDSVDIINMNYIDAIETLENVEEFLEYNDVYTEITVVSADVENSEEIVEAIKACEFSEGGNVECFVSENEIKEQAENENISFGKYRAFLELKEIDDSISIQDIEGLTMNEIRNLIGTNEGNGSGGNGSEGNGNAGNGNAGNGNAGNGNAGNGNAGNGNAGNGNAGNGSEGNGNAGNGSG